MNQNTVIIFFCALSLLIYLISCIKKRPMALLTFAGRSAMGLSYIYLFHSFCIARGITVNLGINPVTILLSSFLGMPGVFLAYGIHLLQYF